MAPPLSGTFDRGGAWRGPGSGLGATGIPETEDGFDRAGAWREASGPLLAPPQFKAEGTRDLTEERFASGAMSPAGTPAGVGDGGSGDDADFDADPLEPGWAMPAEGDGGLAPPAVAGTPPDTVVGPRAVAGGKGGDRRIGGRTGAGVRSPAGSWDPAGLSGFAPVAFTSPQAGIHPGPGGPGAEALLRRSAPTGGLPASPRPSTPRPAVFAKPTLGKGGGSYEGALRSWQDTMEQEGGRVYGKEEGSRIGTEETFGVEESLEKAGAPAERVEETREALAEEAHRAFEAKEKALKAIYDNFSSKDQADRRIREAERRLEKSREREAAKYAAMPNGAEARRANRTAKTARFARELATRAKGTLTSKRREMTPKQYRKAKAAVKAAREAAKAARRAAREAKNAARYGTKEQAKRAAERAERLAAEAVAEAAHALKEVEKTGVTIHVEDVAVGPSSCGEVPPDPGPQGDDGSGCSEKDCGTCAPPCEPDQECVCSWEKEVSSPQTPGGEEPGASGSKGRGVGDGSALRGRDRQADGDPGAGGRGAGAGTGEAGGAAAAGNNLEEPEGPADGRGPGPITRDVRLLRSGKYRGFLLIRYPGRGWILLPPSMAMAIARSKVFVDPDGTVRVLNVFDLNKFDRIAEDFLERTNAPLGIYEIVTQFRIDDEEAEKLRRHDPYIEALENVGFLLEMGGHLMIVAALTAYAPALLPLYFKGAATAGFLLQAVQTIETGIREGTSAALKEAGIATLMMVFGGLITGGATAGMGTGPRVRVGPRAPRPARPRVVKSKKTPRTPEKPEGTRTEGGTPRGEEGDAHGRPTKVVGDGEQAVVPEGQRAGSGKAGDSRQGQVEEVSSGSGSPAEYHRPYIRKAVREEVARRQRRLPDGRPVDPNTGDPINGKPDLGHKYGNEYWREVRKAKAQGLTQKEFNERMNNPDLYQLEDPISNRSHRFEMPQ